VLEVSGRTAELLWSAPHLSLKRYAGVIPCKSQILTVVKVIITISFPASKVSFAKAGGGKSSSVLTSKQAFPSLPSFSLHPPKHMLVLDPLLLQPSWLHDEPVNEHS